MPSSMVHLITAYNYKADSPTEFWIGNLAPDFVENWQEKDKLHFRYTIDREAELIKYAKSINIKDSFWLGSLLHLFVDWKWDCSFLQDYINYVGSKDWFIGYRNEIGLLSAWLYHDTCWSNAIWDEMVAYKFSAINSLVTSAEKNLTALQKSRQFHVENSLAQPTFYSVEAVNQFMVNAAKDFEHWLKSKVVF